jgi:hypothetical protein
MRIVALGLTALIFAGCDSGVTGASTVFGDYELRSVNGSSLPYKVNATTEIVDDMISLAEAFTYTERGHARVTANGQVTNQDIFENGSYSIIGTSVTLTSSDGKHVRIALNENSEKMTFVESGITMVFRK